MRITRIIDPIRHGQISGERIHENKVKSLIRIFNYLHFHLLKTLTNQNAFLLFLACPLALSYFQLQLPQQGESLESKEGSIKKLNWPCLFHENHFHRGLLKMIYGIP